MTLPSQKHLFELPEEIVYLNCAFMGPLSRSVSTAAIEGVKRKTRPWEITPDHFFSEVEETRELFAEIIDGDADGVALAPSVSYGMATAANNLRVESGEEIIVLAEQFPSNIYVWRELARRQEAVVRTVERPPGGNWTDAVLATLGPQTAVAALPHCHWTDGSLLDLVSIGAELRRRGAALVVDGSQSIGALPLDVGAVQPDFLVTVSYKWLLGPYSHALLWVAPRWRDGVPIEYSWFTRANARDFTAVAEYTDDYAAGARRFDVGEASNFALLPATIAALRQTLDWGVERIQQTLRCHTERIAERATELGLGIAPSRHRAGHLVGLRLTGRDPRTVAAAMAAARTYVSVRGDSIRVAPHVYNSSDDIDRFLDTLSLVVSDRSLESPTPA